MKPQSLAAFVLPGAAVLVIARTTGDNCCGLLEAVGLGSRLVYRPSGAYGDSLSTYWSLDNSGLRPACIFVPQSTEEVATAVKVLARPGTGNGTSSKLCHRGCKFAVRGAGHMANPGANNIDDGVTIDFSAMNITTFHSNQSLTSIQPGARWGSIYEELAKSNVMVLGDQASTVGVGGLLLGGGNSFYSTARGFACDGVVNFQVVLANGRIVNANVSSDHADLYRALKGGSNNFGVVTRFDLDTFTAPSKLWGGTIAFASSAGAKLISALQKFVSVLGTEGHKSDSAIVFWTYTRGGTSTEPLIITALHNVDGIADAPGIAEFLAIPGNITSAMRTDTLVGFTNELEVPRGSYNAWRTLTFKNNGKVMVYAVETYQKMVQLLEAELSLGFTAQCMFQGLSVEQFRQAAASGGNVLGLQDRSENLVMFLGMLAYKDPKLTKVVDAEMTAWVDRIKRFARENGADDDYLFLNYADISQNPLGSYGEPNLAFMNEVANKYDPYGLFQRNMPGGFKLSNAQRTAASSFKEVK